MTNKNKLFNIENKSIFVAGHNGMVGSAVCRKLLSENCEILTVSKSVCDLRNQKEVDNWIKKNQKYSKIPCNSIYFNFLC